MNEADNIFVAGFGRCGTAAMMQLLWAGGAPVAGPAPAFEDCRLGPGTTDVAWVRAQRGRVLKWIDPSRSRLPVDITSRTIWLDRAPKDQARSQIKMLRMLTPDMASIGGGPSVSAFARSLKRDRAPTIAALRKRGPVLVVTFKELLAQPLATALRVRRFLGPEFLPDPVRGAKAILNRGPECQPDLWVEQSTSIAWKACEAVKEQEAEL